ncbi:MAG: hypothetical protein IIB73_05940, partial [Proteobacteria bacterium]|nr:hypothetical protein [Pseudomonadota bacterium]
MKHIHYLFPLTLLIYCLGMGNANAIRVFKCANSDGEISFSNRPCATDSTLLKEIDIRDNVNVVGSEAGETTVPESPQSGNQPGPATAGTTSSGGGSADVSGGAGGSAGGGGGSAGGGGDGGKADGSDATAESGEGDATAATGDDSGVPSVVDDSGVPSVVDDSGVPSVVDDSRILSVFDDSGTAATGNGGTSTSTTGTNVTGGTTITRTGTTSSTTTGTSITSPGTLPITSTTQAQTQPGTTTSTDTTTTTADTTTTTTDTTTTTTDPTTTTTDTTTTTTDPTTTTTDPTTTTTDTTTNPPPPGVVTLTNLNQPPNTAYIIDEIQIDEALAEITINGNLFGSGPNIVVYDTFENGVTGGDIPLTNPKNPGCDIPKDLKDLTGAPGPIVGCWDAYAYITAPRYYDIARSGNHSMLIFDDDTNDFLQLNKVNMNDFTEFFISLWARVPDGTFFPGRQVGLELKQFPTDSSWKFAWVIDGNNATKG